jgi:predicted unusual protein kinase regulating ubiquinone biosynthesis (AarF/ABC1/UbiB family)
MSAMMYEFPFRVPAYYALIIRSMVTLEGIAIGIDPNFKVLSKAYPYIAKRLLTDLIAGIADFTAGFTL